MTGYAPRKAQRGVALVALLVMILLAGGYAFYRSANLGSGQNQERDTVLLRLAQAKDAVIAYAVNDTNRPGRLLCPDLVGNGVSPLLSRDDCDSYSGLLPWKTLDLAENNDAQGGMFRYYISPSFGGQSAAVKLNSDTLTTLHLDVPAGSASNDIAALIIATRGAPDTLNDDGDAYFYNGKTNAPQDNDIVIAITRQELMAAVEQRVANELRTCLEQHASSADNLQHTYPWPAPLSNSIFKGATKSLFGMVPDTQAGNPEQALKDVITRLTDLQNSLNSASTAADQLKVAYQIQTEAASARALFDRIYLLAVDLSDKANQAKAAFQSLDNTFVSATVSKATFTAQAGSLPAAMSSAYPALTAFIASLKNSGFDLFLMEMESQNPALRLAIDTANAVPSTANFKALTALINPLDNLVLENSWTPNQFIESQIIIASNTAKAAVSAAKANPVIVPQAIALANELYNTNLAIEATILASRFNVDSSEISFRAERINAASANAIASSFSTESLNALGSTLTSTQILITSLSSASPALNAARATTLSALDNAIAAAKAGSDQALVCSTSDSAAAQLTALAGAMANNGDNVTLETLKSVAATLSPFQQTAPLNVTAGRALRTTIGTILDWSDNAISRAADLARLARKGISSQGDSDTSGYTASRKLLDSLDGDTGSIARLENYSKNGSDAAARQAQEALNNTQSLLSNLLFVAAKLDSSLETSLGEAAIPTVWYGSACLFLQPPTGSSTWWTANDWKNLVFYQISDRIRPASGQLTVNGSGNYRAVAIATGKALPTQDRAVRESKSYLEGLNTDNSRNGDAQSPSPRFSVEAVSPNFNDRLAY